MLILIHNLYSAYYSFKKLDWMNKAGFYMEQTCRNLKYKCEMGSMLTLFSTFKSSEWGSAMSDHTPQRRSVQSYRRCCKSRQMIPVFQTGAETPWPERAWPIQNNGEKFSWKRAARSRMSCLVHVPIGASSRLHFQLSIVCTGYYCRSERGVSFKSLVATLLER